MDEVEGQGEVSEVEVTPTDTAVDDSPAEASSEATPSPDPVEPEEDFSPDKFDWDGWDGSNYEAFKEPVRPWVERVSQFHQSKMDKELERERNELGQLRSIYEDLMSGHEDPRLATTAAELEKFKTQLQEQETKYAELERQHAEYQAAIDEMHLAEAKAAADKFREENADIFKDEAKTKLLGELLDEDWDLQSIPRVMKLTPEAQAVVRQAKREGVSDSWALKVGEAAKPRAPKPRPAADLVTGSSGATPTPTVVPPGKGDARNFDELRDHAIKRAMNGSRRQ